MICKICNTDKHLSAFEWQKDRPSPRSTCSKCRHELRDYSKERQRRSEYAQKQRKENGNIIRMQWEKAVYGKCKEDIPYNHCYICGKTEDLNIDHCHSSGRVRGLLCGPCNRGIGLLKEDPYIMQAAISYVRHFELMEP